MRPWSLLLLVNLITWEFQSQQNICTYFIYIRKQPKLHFFFLRNVGKGVSFMKAQNWRYNMAENQSYRKTHKNSDTQKFAVITLKLE